MGEGGGGEEKGSFSPSALSLFRFHLSLFPPETPDTQAKATAPQMESLLTPFPHEQCWVSFYTSTST